MMKVKLISSGYDSIETYVNDWIEKNKPSRIYDIKYQFCAFRDKMESYSITHEHRAMILYEE